jgi:FtsP/CotA-like multicopper oxidase with cupredoxin domain
VLSVVVVASSSAAASGDALRAELGSTIPKRARANGRVVEFDLVAAPTELRLVDGRALRVWAYNGQVPGPTFRVRLGDTVRVRFTNRLSQETTVHWHGVRVPNGMDGVPNLTQPPIAPGGSFDYEFTPKDAGTFWFHPHVRSSEQVERGLYGVLIVDDEQPLPFSRDIVWVIDDWLLDASGQIFPEFNTPHDLMHDGRWGNFVTVNGRTDTTLTVRSGERIRLRLLNASNGRVYLPDFGGLEPRIIAVDGLYAAKPIDPRGFELAPGNRIDLDLRFTDASSARYDIVDRFYPPQPNRLATVVVDGIADATPSFASPAHAHVPRWSQGAGAPLAKTFRLSSRRGGEHGIEWTINDHAFAGHDHAAPPALIMQADRFVHLRFVNDSFRLHPIHLHGMFFRLLARNGTAVDEPFFRDTVLVHSKETIDIGLVPLDVGDWMMHCHILEHAEAGMMTTLRVVGD